MSKPNLRQRLGLHRRYALVVDSRKCINCKACVVACKAENSVPIGKFRNWINEETRGEYPSLMASFEPEQCHHCDSPSCVRVCPTGASWQRGDGLVLVEADDCIGCGYCIIACPYDARFFNPESRIADKCTMCAHRVDHGRLPACVETCPTKVRVFDDLNAPGSRLKALLSTRRYMVKKMQTGNGPQIYYLL
jgi:tetrathionate reductase subunit B